MKISVKKIMLFSFILMELVSMAAFANTQIPPRDAVYDANESLRIKIYISFVIGRRRDCEGFGFCEWEIGITTGRVNSGSATAYIDDNNKNLLVMEIDKLKGITAECYKKYFSTGKFLVEDDSQIPSEIGKALGLATNKTVIAGNYIIIERNGILYLNLPLK
jgi:hypothetical protein